MALTSKQRKFVEALARGASNKDAAIAAGYSEATASQAGSRLAKHPDVLAALDRKTEAAPELPPAAPTPPTAEQSESSGGEVVQLPKVGLAALGLTSDPKDVLVAIMNDIEEDPKLRLEAAKSLMPYAHKKLGDQGKKEAGKAAAGAVATGRFAPPAPPLRMINGGK